MSYPEGVSGKILQEKYTRVLSPVITRWNAFELLAGFFGVVFGVIYLLFYFFGGK